MNENDIELLYIVPYEISYDGGEYYYSDEINSDVYIPAHTSTYKKSPLFFDNIKQLQKWFYKNAGNPIPKVYRIKYLSTFKGIDNVLKITNLQNDKTRFFSILNKEYSLEHDVRGSILYKNNIWEEVLNKFVGFNLRKIYNEFQKRGVKISRSNNELKFDCICDVYYESSKMEGKKLVLNRENPELQKWY